MNKLKIVGAGMIGVNRLTNDQWLLIVSIIITVLGMIQDYLRDRKESNDQTKVIPSRVNDQNTHEENEDRGEKDGITENS